jgi:hypothetical protein
MRRFGAGNVESGSPYPTLHSQVTTDGQGAALNFLCSEERWRRARRFASARRVLEASGQQQKLDAILPGLVRAGSGWFKPGGQWV